MSSRRKYHSVREYLADVPPLPRRRLNEIRRLVRKHVPRATETISYNIPAFRLGRTFMYCAAFKDHISIFPPLRADAALSRALRPYRNPTGNLLFDLADPLPLTLVARIARALARGHSAAVPARRRGP